MIKYIDAELLKKGLKDLESVIYSNELVGRPMHPYDNGQLHAINIMKELIDSLQQEQPCDTCTNDKGCVTCKDGELWESKEQPFEDLEKEIKTWIPAHIVGGDKAPRKELKDVVIQWAGIVARHFYILGLKNNIPVTQITLDELAKEEEPVTEDLEEAAENYAEKHGFRVPYDGSEKFYDETDVKASKDGFIEGAEWQKSKMLKDAVEGLICATITGTDAISFLSPLPKELTAGDKVKIIIVKED